MGRVAPVAENAIAAARKEDALTFDKNRRNFLTILTEKVRGYRPRVFQNKLTPESVAWAYRLLLGREPESETVIAEKLSRITNNRELIQEFINSEEFREKNAGFHYPALDGNEPQMQIDEVRSEADLEVLFKHIQDAWQAFGETEPYLSVATSDQFKLSNIHKTREIFYETGRKDVARLFNSLERNGVDRKPFKLCMEYGCGLGRVTRWLAEHFERVFAYDISKPHLQHAAEYLSEAGIKNVTLGQIARVQDVGKIPKVDLIYSLIVLQHNPPPVISYIVRAFVKALNPGGVAYFQVPTYRAGYRFSLKEYLSDAASRLEMEMHVLPQCKIFEIASEEGARPLEVLEDTCTGSRYGEMSSTFLIQKTR